MCKKFYDISLSHTKIYEMYLFEDKSSTAAKVTSFSRSTINYY